MTTFGIRTANPRDALEIIATGRKPLADLLDTLEAVPAVGGGVLLIVLLAEIVEVAFEDCVEVVVPARNVPFFRNRLCNSWRAHIKTYGQNRLPASQGVWIYRSQHNMAHAPDAFSSLRSCVGAGDARRYKSNFGIANS
jgi:hypothetical protein